jgi:hypothetical protein
VPDGHIAGFIRAREWDALLTGKADELTMQQVTGVIIENRPVKPDRYISAVVCFPLSAECTVVRRERLVPRPWSNEAASLGKRPRGQQELGIKRHRDLAADMTIPAANREIEVAWADFLEEALGFQ